MEQNERLFINKINLPMIDENNLEIKYSYYDMDLGKYGVQKSFIVKKEKVEIKKVWTRTFPEKFLFVIPFLDKKLKYEIPFLDISKNICFKIDWKSFKMTDEEFNQDILHFIEECYKLYDLKKYIIEKLIMKNYIIKNMKKVINSEEKFDIYKDIIEILNKCNFIKDEDYIKFEYTEIRDGKLNMDLSDNYYPINLITKDINKLNLLKDTLEGDIPSINKEGEK